MSHTSHSYGFVSCAQNAEDVMLYRALKDVHNGFYIDVGAHDPEYFSVTKAFYDRGWHGINIEPEDSCWKRLCSERPHDVNLQVLSSDRTGSSDFYEVLETGLSTQSADLAAVHKNQGFSVIKVNRQSTKLDEVCEQYVRGDIHFLKIDVEGAEEEVLRGLSLVRHRPWIIVVEATEPLSQNRCNDGISNYLAAREYKHVYFDGLNSFYVAAEQSELSRHFDRPANPLDGYVQPFFLAAERLKSYQRLVSWRLVLLEDKVRSILRHIFGKP
jgi:FkbM family methyltransferase